MHKIGGICGIMSEKGGEKAMMRIQSLRAWRILDSRGNPTVACKAMLECGATGYGDAPAGASTGSHEAHENRDGGEAFGGKDVLNAVRAVNIEIADALTGMDAANQRAIDAAMIALDGTEDKSRLGANAMLAASIAIASAAANAAGMPVYRWLGGAMAGEMPCPMMNVLNGGRHADNNIDIQEFMLVPSGADDFAGAMRMGAECYRALKTLLLEKGLSTGVGDEGGFAPNLESAEQALELLVRAIERAGWVPGEDVSLAIDAAANEWRTPAGYRMLKSGQIRTREALIDEYAFLASRFPLVSIEDPLGEEDFDGFREMTDRMGDEIMIVGDDLFTTSAERLLQGAALGAGNAILIKPNQVGTITETLETVALAWRAGYAVVLSHRSGDTESSFLGDFAAAINADYLKCGAPARSERLAKYNRLLAIEDELRG